MQASDKAPTLDTRFVWFPTGTSDFRHGIRYQNTDLANARLCLPCRLRLAVAKTPIARNDTTGRRSRSMLSVHGSRRVDIHLALSGCAARQKLGAAGLCKLLADELWNVESEVIKDLTCFQRAFGEQMKYMNASHLSLHPFTSFLLLTMYSSGRLSDAI